MIKNDSIGTIPLQYYAEIKAINRESPYFRGATCDQSDLVMLPLPHCRFTNMYLRTVFKNFYQMLYNSLFFHTSEREPGEFENEDEELANSYENPETKPGYNFLYFVDIFSNSKSFYFSFYRMN